MMGYLVQEQTGRAATASAPDVVDARAHEFRRQLDRSLDRSYRLAAVILGDRVEAEDAVHDAALAAWRHRAGLRDGDRFDAWFQRILVNGCRDRLRARQRRRVVDVSRELSEAEHPSQSDAGDSLADADLVDRALRRLAPDERLIVVLRYHADLTVPAIAGVIGIPEGTVKSRLHAALQRLRTAIEETGR